MRGDVLVVRRRELWVTSTSVRWSWRPAWPLPPSCVAITAADDAGRDRVPLAITSGGWCAAVRPHQCGAAAREVGLDGVGGRLGVDGATVVEQFVMSLIGASRLGVRTGSSACRDRPTVWSVCRPVVWAVEVQRGAQLGQAAGGLALHGALAAVERVRGLGDGQLAAGAAGRRRRASAAAARRGRRTRRAPVSVGCWIRDRYLGQLGAGPLESGDRPAPVVDQRVEHRLAGVGVDRLGRTRGHATYNRINAVCTRSSATWWSPEARNVAVRTSWPATGQSRSCGTPRPAVLITAVVASPVLPHASTQRGQRLHPSEEGCGYSDLLRGSALAGEGELAGLRDQPAGRVPHRRLLVEPAVGDAAGAWPRTAASRARAVPRSSTVSSTVGAQPYLPRLNTVGGPAVDGDEQRQHVGLARRRATGTSSASPARRSAFGNGAVAGSIRISTWSNSSTVKLRRLRWSTHSSGGGISGGGPADQSTAPSRAARRW